MAEAAGNAFITPEWRDAAVEVYETDGSGTAKEDGRGTTSFVAVWRDGDGELRLVLPLIATRSTGVEMIRMPGFQVGDLFGPATDLDDPAGALAGIAAAVHQRFPAAVWMFDNADPAFRDAVAGSPALARFRAIGDTTVPLPHIRFGDEGWQGFLARRSRNFRSQIGRRRRNLERDHEISFRLTTEARRVATDLDTVLDLHLKRWQQRGGSGAITPLSRRFHHRFAAAAFERGWLRLWILEIDGRPAAGWYGWRLGDVYSYYQAGFDPRFEDRAVGTVMLAHTIEQAASEGAAVYDLLLGDEDYKARFANGERQVVTVAHAPPASMAAGLLRAESLARRAVRAVPAPVKSLPMRVLRPVVKRLPGGSRR